MLPAAFISHQTSGRLRIKIPSKKGNAPYFSALGEALSRFRAFERIELNPNTGSVLIIDEGLESGPIFLFAEEHQLFDLEEKELPVPLSRRMMAPLGDLNDSLGRFTGGELDLPGMIFLGLMTVGVYQIAIGNFGALPWYTAFWYAFGVFTKSIVK